MGIYLNPDHTFFQDAVNSKIYVDKTELIAHTNSLIRTEQKYICVSRPRRFGKSMAANMLTAYYSRGCDSAELFAPYKIAKEDSFHQHLNQYTGIHTTEGRANTSWKRKKSRSVSRTSRRFAAKTAIISIRQI